MELTLSKGRGQPRAPRQLMCLGVPPDIWRSIAEQLEMRDRLNLSATCRTLRAESLQWFCGSVFGLGMYHTRPADPIKWLCWVQAQVRVELDGQHAHILNALISGGARIVQLGLLPYPQPWCKVPPELAGLTQLRELSLAGNVGVWQLVPAAAIEGGWQHIPHQLQQLNMGTCGLQQVPAELAGLAALSELVLCDNPIEGGWQHLPRQLQQLDLGSCGLRQVPAELAGLERLTKLSLAGNSRFEGGWQHLPRQLQHLDLSKCGLPQLPPELAGLALQIFW